jgi:hypothetical protein
MIIDQEAADKVLELSYRFGRDNPSTIEWREFIKAIQSMVEKPTSIPTEEENERIMKEIMNDFEVMK